MAAPKTVFMFSGQGSQYLQMGRALFDGNGCFRECMIRLDAIAKELTGHSIVKVLYSPGHYKGAMFDRTLLTHPAVFMVEYSLGQCLMHSGVLPDFAIGVSLGSFAAATIAGVIDVKDALSSVICQAIALERFCEPGGMIAVLSDSALFMEEGLSESCELAAVNLNRSFVVSARLAEMARIEMILRDRNVAYQRLPVAFAFHSRWIDAARAPFESFMRSLQYMPSKLPLVCCDQAAIIANVSSNHFWMATRRQMRFREAIAQLEVSGTYRYIDAGPASTLATVLKHGQRSASGPEVHSILTPFGHDLRNFADLVKIRPAVQSRWGV